MKLSIKQYMQTIKAQICPAIYYIILAFLSLTLIEVGRLSGTIGECSGSVVDQGAVGLSLTGVNALCP